MSAAPASGNVSLDAEAQVYDAIIVGARCAGSPTAMLLARRLWPHGAEILAPRVWSFKVNDVREE